MARLQKRYFESKDFMTVAQITTISNQTTEKHRLIAIIEELLTLNSSSKVQNLILHFNIRAEVSQNVDVSCILHNSTFIYKSKTTVDHFIGIL